MKFTLHALALLVEFLILLVVPEHRTEHHYEHQDTQNLEDGHPKPDPLEIPENLVFRNYDGHGPAGTLYRSEIHEIVRPLVSHVGMAGLSGEERGTQIPGGHGVHHVRSHLVYGFGHNQRFHRANHYASLAAQNHVIGVGIDGEVAYKFGEPVQGDVGREHCGNAAAGIFNRHREGGHEDVAAAGVDVWLRPVSGLVFKCSGKPFLSRIIVFFRGERSEAQLAVRCLKNIRGEQRAAGQISGNHCNGGAYHHGIVFHYALGNTVKAVWYADAPLGNPDAVAHRRFGLVDDVHYLVLSGFKLAFGALVSLFLHPLAGECILEDGSRLKSDDHHYDDHQPRPRPLAYDISYLVSHRMLFNAARNSGIGRLLSRSIMRVLRPAYGLTSSSISFRGMPSPK